MLSLIIFIPPIGQAQTNGCGPQFLGFISDLLPNGPVGLKSNLFLEACNAHDICYQARADDTQASCDTEFLNTMTLACEANYTVTESLEYCKNSAQLFYSLTDQYGENAVSTRFQTDATSKTINNFAKLELSTSTITSNFLGDDLTLCINAKNSSKINTGFQLFLYAAKDRVEGELPDADFLLAWYPYWKDDSFFLRAGESKNICLSTDGLAGIARNIHQFQGRYRLELWVKSARRDVGLKLADILENDISTP